MVVVLSGNTLCGVHQGGDSVFVSVGIDIWNLTWYVEHLRTNRGVTERQFIKNIVDSL